MKTTPQSYQKWGPRDFDWNWPRLLAALTKSVTEMEEVQNELSTAYTQGVVDGFGKEILDPTLLKVHPRI